MQIVLPNLVTEQQARFGARGVQFVLSLLALIFVSVGFKSQEYGGYSAMAGSRAKDFVLLWGYTAMLYTLWAIVLVEILGLQNRLFALIEAAVDAVVAAVFLVAGIALSTSDVVHHCDLFTLYSPVLRCGALKASCWFTFLSMLAFIGSSLVIYLCHKGIIVNAALTTDIDAPYTSADVTPAAKNPLSPMGPEVSTPEARV